jgi:hypothetical protein
MFSRLNEKFVHVRIGTVGYGFNVPSGAVADQLISTIDSATNSLKLKEVPLGTKRVIYPTRT